MREECRKQRKRGKEVHSGMKKGKEIAMQRGNKSLTKNKVENDEKEKEE